MEGATAAGADDAGPITQADRIRAALWGLFVSDALAMPTHWYYGGSWQIQKDFGGPITKFERSQRSFPGSIMNKSNTGGGGRGSDRGSIIGDVINHGKKKYWTSGKGFHYHHTLERGENTLEAQLVRVLMKSIVACGGAFRREHFCDAYVQFMTTPGSHNDTYASTAHRQFFENFVKGVDPMQCASNDGHNTDAIDALVLPAVVGLATLNQPLEAAVAAAQECGEVTRRSQPVQAYIAMVVGMLRAVAEGAQGRLQEVTRGVAAAQFPRLDLDAERDLVTAWWFHLNYKYAGRLREGVLVNANAGGENVHRGELLGLALGLQEGRSSAVADFVAALRDHKKLAVEIEAFVQCVSGSGGGSGGGGGGSEGGAGGDGGDAGRGEGGDGDGDDDEAALPATL